MISLARIIIILISLNISVLMNGETVSQKDASAIAHRFFNAARGEVMAKPKLVWNGKKLTTDRLFTPFYVYNNPAGGFVVISAENKAFPILAYSLKDNFDPSGLSQTEMAIFKLYARHIEQVRYNDVIPYKAIDCWNNLNNYINGVLSSQGFVTDSRITVEEADNLLQYVENADNYNGYSFIYSPEQWQGLIEDEFFENKVVALGIIDGDIYCPTVVNGVKNGFVSIDGNQNIPGKKSDFINKRNGRMFSIYPTETISEGYIADIGGRGELFIEEDNNEDQPFKLFDDLLLSIEEDKQAEELQFRRNETLKSMKDVLHGEAVIRSSGGGHYEILLPEEVKLTRVYSLSGAFLQEKYFKGTNRAFIDISHEPSGFYILQVISAEGKPYSFKLYR